MYENINNINYICHQYLVYTKFIKFKSIICSACDGHLNLEEGFDDAKYIHNSIEE